MYFEVSKLLWTFYTLIMTLLRLKSSFFCMIWVLFPMCGRLLLDQIYDRTAIKKKPKDWKWLMVHLLSVVVPLTFNIYYICNVCSNHGTCRICVKSRFAHRLQSRIDG